MMLPRNQDEWEAEHGKYSNDCIIVLPISSGRLAVFNNARQLAGIAYTWADIGFMGIPKVKHISLPQPTTTLSNLDHLVKGLKL